MIGDRETHRLVSEPANDEVTFGGNDVSRLFLRSTIIPLHTHPQSTSVRNWMTHTVCTRRRGNTDGSRMRRPQTHVADPKKALELSSVMEQFVMDTNWYQRLLELG